MRPSESLTILPLHLRNRRQASITTRKGGKRLAIWDLNISLEWAAAAAGDEGKEVGLRPGVNLLLLLLLLLPQHMQHACRHACKRTCKTRTQRPQVKGSIEVKEVSSAHDDEDDILFEFSAEGVGAEQEASKAAAARLKPAILEALAEFGRRMHALE
jgi:hypothetical protein